MAELLAEIPQSGRLEAIGLSPRRRAAMQSVTQAELITDGGILGDHHAWRGGKRQVTLIQFEHLAVVAALTGRADLSFSVLRRNLVISGINLLALKNKQFRIGAVLLEGTGLCHPCSRMEENLGAGGYNAMRGHGGLTARVLEGGLIRVGDTVICLPALAAANLSLF